MSEVLANIKEKRPLIDPSGRKKAAKRVDVFESAPESTPREAKTADKASESPPMRRYPGLPTPSAKQTRIRMDERIEGRLTDFCNQHEVTLEVLFETLADLFLSGNESEIAQHCKDRIADRKSAGAYRRYLAQQQKYRG